MVRHYRNIYLGSDSWWAVKDKVYAVGYGVNRETAPNIIALILLDLKRGYSYDKHGKRIRFGLRKALKRLYYLVTLSARQSPRDKPYITRLVHYVVQSLSLPSGIRVNLEGKNKRLAYSLLREYRIVGDKKKARVKPLVMVER